MGSDQVFIHNLRVECVLGIKDWERTNKQTGETGRIVNMIDWRALRPGRDHFAYTIAKSGLAALTQSAARNLAPKVQVNGLLPGAILPHKGASQDKVDSLTKQIPMGRWGTLEEVVEAVIFLLDGPGYITGELMHLDGGRHLV